MAQRESAWVPRSFLENPDEFGKVDLPSHRAPADIEEAGQMIASIAQHRAAYVLSSHRRSGLSVRDLAERTGTTEGYLSGQLNGRYPAGFDDIARWALAVQDLSVLPAFSTLEGMEPTP